MIDSCFEIPPIVGMRIQYKNNKNIGIITLVTPIAFRYRYFSKEVVGIGTTYGSNIGWHRKLYLIFEPKDILLRKNKKLIRTYRLQFID